MNNCINISKNVLELDLTPINKGVTKIKIDNELIKRHDELVEEQLLAHMRVFDKFNIEITDEMVEDLSKGDRRSTEKAIIEKCPLDLFNEVIALSHDIVVGFYKLLEEKEESLFLYEQLFVYFNHSFKNAGLDVLHSFLNELYNEFKEKIKNRGDNNS